MIKYLQSEKKNCKKHTLNGIEVERSNGELFLFEVLNLVVFMFVVVVNSSDCDGDSGGVLKEK